VRFDFRLFQQYRPEADIYASKIRGQRAYPLLEEARPFIQINGQGDGKYPASCFHTEWEDDMPDSVYDVILLIGSSKESWEKAAANAVEQASKSLRNLRVAEIVELDMQLDAKGKAEAYRAKVRLSFKVER
jgi:flavin-binding protein dodecin